MEQYRVILHTLMLFLILFVLFLIYKYVIGYLKFRRLHEFSISSKKDRAYEVTFLYNVIFKFSKFLRSLVVFNSVADSYEAYINSDSKFKNGMDFISLKILLGVFLDILYLFSSFLYYGNVDVFSIFILFIVGFFVLDIAFYFKYRKDVVVISNDILKAVVIMNNSFKANRNVEQALNDVVSRLDGPINYEFRKVIYDMKVGLSLSEAFKRMYQRTKIGAAFEMSNMMSLVNNGGVNVSLIFEKCEAKLLDSEKLRIKIKSIRKFNLLYYIIFMLAPLVVTFFIFASNASYLEIFQTNYGIFIFVILVFLYSNYLLILRNVFRRSVL